MNEKEVLKWLEKARTQPPNWEMYTKVQAYVVEKAKVLGIYLKSTSIDMEGLVPKAEKEVYEAMLDHLEWLWDYVWEKTREEQKVQAHKRASKS